MKTEAEIKSEENKLDNTNPNLPSDNNDDYEDDDICSPSHLEKLFKHKYKMHDESPMTFDSSYVLNLAKDDSFTCIAAGLSDGSVRVFEVDSEKGVYVQPPPVNKNKKESVSTCGIRFLDETPNLLLVGTTNCLVRLLDLRTRNEVRRFENLPANKFEPTEILCFDRNSNGSMLCMGSAAVGGDMNLSFYDMRSSYKLFKYTECHQDDVNTLCFHPEDPDLLCSGSTDGLINIFNIASTEDKAILTTINTESSVYKVNWHKNTKGQDIVSCITPTNCFASYALKGDVIAKFDRLKITEAIKRKNETNCTLINCHSMSDKSLMLLTGSNLNDGAILRSCRLNKGELLPYANFEGNTQIVRESIFDAKTEILITAGENGFVTLWTPSSWEDQTTDASSSSSFKMKTKKSNKVAPY